MSRKSPQEKKVLSYTKDRRNDYGEHDKGSRRSIRRNKRAPLRADRRRAHQVLAGATEATEATVAAEVAEARLASRPFRLRITRWQKSPDAPLGEYVEQRIRRRIALGVEDQAGGAERIERIRRRLRGRRVVYPHYIGWTND